MSEPAFQTLLFQKLLDMLYTEKAISVPKEFHSRCAKIKSLLENDITGLINTLTSFSVNSAYNTSYRVECPEGFENLEEALNEWLDSLNSNIEGIPSGIRAISKEYYQERWQGSSLLLLRVKNWKETESGIKLVLPKIAYYVNGASVWVKTPNVDNFKLGSFEYYLNKDEKPSSRVPLNKNENIVVQKPFSRWFSDYAVPYLIKTGVYKNYKSIELLQDKGDEVITKIIPYLFMIKKGSEAMSLQLKSTYKDAELKEMQGNLKDALETYKSEKNKVPTWATNWDTEAEHLIPDLAKVLREDLYAQSYRAVLSGLGFVDVVQGIASTRKESVLNPKPFIAEINSGVEDFKSMIMEVVNLIVAENKLDHRKLFSSDNKLRIINTPLRINVETMEEIIRSGYDRGTISIQSYSEAIGCDFEVERERRKAELANGDEDLMYPHLVQNQESTPDRGGVSAKPRNDVTNKKENKSGPEAKNFKAELDLIIAPYKNLNEVPPYIKKMEEDCQKVFMETFNSVYEDTKDEGKAFSISINAAKRCMGKKGYVYDKESKNWIKKENK